MLKSAYELAMEKSGGGAKKLTPGQKAKLAEIDSRYDAQIAQAEIPLQTALLATAPEEADVIREKLAREKESINSRREKEKEKVRRGA